MNVKCYRFGVLLKSTIKTTTNGHIVGDKWFTILFWTNIIPVFVEGAQQVEGTGIMMTPVALKGLFFLASFNIIEITLTFVRATTRLRPAGANSSA